MVCVKNIIAFILTTIILVVMFLPGYFLYFTSKLLRALGYLMIMRPLSARQELQNFWSIEYVLGDIR